MLTVYGLKSCDTCRKAQKFLQAHNIEFRFHDLREQGLDIQMLERWADRIDWQKLLNKQSLSWRKVPEADRADMNRSKALAAMIEQPTLVKRPVLEHKDYFAVGFSEARFSKHLGLSS
ncbi:MAG TPA: arsenate reductase [Woeseiaceae bacterium]|nr:arsenate reductase [Woeseiaceae bacterium]